MLLNRLKKYKLLITALALATIFLWVWVLKTPSIYVTQIPPSVINSKIGEQQAFLITIKNNRPFPLYVTDSVLHTEGLFHTASGITTDDSGAFSYQDPYWRVLEILPSNEYKLSAFAEVKLIFISELNKEIGLIEGASLLYKYLGVEYSTSINGLNMVVLDTGVSEDIKWAMEKMYPGHGNGTELTTNTFRR